MKFRSSKIFWYQIPEDFKSKKRRSLVLALSLVKGWISYALLLDSSKNHSSSYQQGFQLFSPLLFTFWWFWSILHHEWRCATERTHVQCFMYNVVESMFRNSKSSPWVYVSCSIDVNYSQSFILNVVGLLFPLLSKDFILFLNYNLYLF